MFDRPVALTFMAVWIGCAVGLTSPVHAAGRQRAPVERVGPGGASHVWSRLFLLDGQILSVVGEFTRLDEVVMVQVPLGPPTSEAVPEARTVTIDAAAVDWARTDAYRDALRRAQFEQSAGQRAYNAFTEEVAATLRDVALLPDPLERIRRLEAARVQLSQWPAANHGFRAADVAQTLSVVDDLLNGMRAAAGQQAFALALTSGPTTSEAATPALLPPPTLQEIVAQALALAPRLTDAAERVLLLQSAEAMLLTSAPAADRRWVRTTVGRVRRQIKTERNVTQRYARLRAWMLDTSAHLLSVADVRGLMRMREEVAARDGKLQRQRPGEVASLLATLDTRLELARRRRLLLERWTERQPALQAYTALVSPHLAVTAALPRALADVKALSGPDPGLLARAEAQLAAARDAAGRAAVPEEAQRPQQLWLSAQQLAARALQSRRAAVRTGDLQQAWEASAAAAGALMLLQQLRIDVPGLLRPPALPAPATP